MRGWECHNILEPLGFHYLKTWECNFVNIENCAGFILIHEGRFLATNL